MQSDLYLLQREAEFLANGETSFRKLIDDLQKQHERESKKSNHVGTATSTEDNDMNEEFAALQQRLSLAKTRKREAQARRKQLALDAYHRVQLLRSLRERANELSSEHAALLDCVQAIQVENTRVLTTLDYRLHITHNTLYYYLTGFLSRTIAPTTCHVSLISLLVHYSSNISILFSISLNCPYRQVNTFLRKLAQCNAINDAFHIWYAGPFATINGFRLGNLTTRPIEWTEINAALGQAVLAGNAFSLPPFSLYTVSLLYLLHDHDLQPFVYNDT